MLAAQAVLITRLSSGRVIMLRTYSATSTTLTTPAEASSPAQFPHSSDTPAPSKAKATSVLPLGAVRIISPSIPFFIR